MRACNYAYRIQLLNKIETKHSSELKPRYTQKEIKI